MSRALQVVKLNAQVAGLALRGRWLNQGHVAQGYNGAAATYNEAWQRRLRPVTDELLARLPGGEFNRIIDLGSGTGYTALHLARANPNTEVIAVDISKDMLEVARQNAPGSLRLQVADMLDFAQRFPAADADLMVSTWALGYSHYGKLFKECGRILRPNGTLGFIVNYADTLRPVFAAFEQCMLRFPERVRLAAWPHFPKRWADLESALTQNGFTIEFHRDGEEKIEPPPSNILAWLRQTGILSGFDQMLDLGGPAGQFLEDFVQARRDQVFHHYTLAVAQKRDTA